MQNNMVFDTPPRLKILTSIRPGIGTWNTPGWRVVAITQYGALGSYKIRLGVSAAHTNAVLSGRNLSMYLPLG